MKVRKILKYVIFVLAAFSIILGGMNQTQRSAAMPASPTDESKVPHYFGPNPNWANSPLTNPDVAVEITGDGTGAAAVATVGANGAVTGITVTNPGVNYTNANVNIISTNVNASGATASAVVTLSGIVTSVTVTNGGAGYTHPVVSFSGGGGAVTPASVSPSSLTDTYLVSLGSATGGSFALVVNGTSVGPISFGALAADVQTALGNAGFAASVAGSGSAADPYVVVFVTPPTTFSLDSALLTQPSTVPVSDAAATAGLTHTHLATIGSATGGSFTLTVDGATTALLAWSALAADVQTALANAGVTATVTGAGSLADPYVIVFVNAPVVVTMDSTALTRGVLDTSVTPFIDPAKFFVTVGSATGGGFTLTVDGATTALLSWNALAADVQTALANAGITATVSGTGALGDPYVIIFAVAPASVTMDSTALTQGVLDASATPTADPATYLVTVGSATGGSFALNVDAAITAPIAWSALAADVQTALANAGVTATVTGTGSLADPYVILFATAPASVLIDSTGLTQGVADASVAPGLDPATFVVSAGSATGGSFTLNVDGTISSPILWNASAADVTAAFPLGFVTVTDTGGVGPWTLTFAAVPALAPVLDAASLTQGVLDAGINPSSPTDTYFVTVGSATGGTFLLSVGTATTAPIAWSALAADVQTELSNVGITATVTGSGSLADPYVIVLAAPALLTMDPAALTQTVAVPVSDASATPGATHIYNATIGTATGGTFLLTVDGATTAPIAWNALAANVQSALLGAGVTANVTGSGSTADPWIITFAVAPTAVSLDGTALTQALINATATAYGGVDAVTVTNGGFGYQMPTVDFDMPDAADGVQASAHAEMDANGTITAVVVDTPGSGYSFAPNVVIRDGTLFDPIAHDPATFVEATASATLVVQSVVVDTFGAGYVTAPDVIIDEGDINGAGQGATGSASVSAGGVTSITLLTPGSGYITSGGIRKFLDPLPGLCVPPACPLSGKYIPAAVPEYKLYNGIEADEYEIGLVQYRTSFSSDLPPTLVRGYIQLETPANAAISQHYPVVNELQDGTQVPVLKSDGTQWLAVTPPQWLGPTIIAEKNKPVRIVFYNLLPTGSDGDLFLPTDSTLMGSGMVPMTMADPLDQGSVMDDVRNPMCSEYPKGVNCFKDNRATLHLHGGTSPWISDGTAHQWTTPAGESTMYPQGVSVSDVPDMDVCKNGDDGCLTFYYTNQQSARLLFYHDHSWGITRLNVYAGEAAGYLITDDVEQLLFGPSGTFASLGEGIPLIVQDRTFVPDADQLALQDPTWDVARWGSKGSFWYHHVYMPAQNPGDPGGMSAYGRWMYGPWFWPPAADTKYGPIANPYYDPTCNLDDPNTWQYDTDPFCEPQLIPGTPNISVGMEQFNDTPIVNGVAYPTITLEPKTYRFRMLNAANDRFFNFQWYVADPTTASTGLNALDEVIGGTEVALNAAEVAAAQLDPVVFPTPNTAVSLPGPDWVHIGSEGGFLPKPFVTDGQQVTTWITDPTRFDVGNVDLHSLLLAPAERADVIVDFSQFAGQTLILYNDAPAAFPARVPSYDYYTGYPDMWPNGPSAILPGYGPNTRTVMQVKIAAVTPATPFDQPGTTNDGLGRLQTAFNHKANGTGVFEAGQHPIIVGQAAYNTAYGTSFAASSNCNAPGSTLQRCDGFVRVNDTLNFGFNTLKAPLTKFVLPLQPKAIHDEMNATTFDEFGRMQANLGVEAQPPTPGAQNVTLYPFVNPATELIDATNLPKQNVTYDANGLPVSDIKITPIGTADGSQIWRITHNGVDTHPIHFHLYDVQVINRVTWDNIILPTEPGELGWKDTVRISPLEDTIVALRPIIPEVPFELPNAIRPLNPMMPIGSTAMFNNFDPQGNPTNLIINDLVNFGWEYVYHCHILSHEEMDMMRPVSVALPPNKPDGLAWSVSGSGNKTQLLLTWNDNSINETGFLVQRYDGTNWVNLGTVPSPLDQPNIHEQRSFIDTSFRWNGNSYAYRVVAQNTIGYGMEYPSLTAQSVSASVAAINPPSNLLASLQAGPVVNLSWMDNSGNETGFVVERSTDGVTFNQIATAPAHNNTGVTGYTDNSVVLGTTYYYRVAAVNALGKSAYSIPAVITVDIPLAPSNVSAVAAPQGNGERVTLTWTNNANNVSSFEIQRATDANFTLGLVTTTVPGTTTSYTTGTISRINYYFRIRAVNVLGASVYMDATPFPVPPVP